MMPKVSIIVRSYNDINLIGQTMKNDFGTVF